MRITFALFALSFFLAAADPAEAQNKVNQSYNGVWVSTPYPAFSVPTTGSVTLDLKVHNTGLPPQQVTLGVERKPKGWTDAFLGGGKKVSSVFVAPNEQADVKLHLEPPPQSGEGTYEFLVSANANGSRFTLPIKLSIGGALPPKLILKPELPALKGSVESDFEFKVKVRNDGGGDATVGLDATAPDSFLVKFMEEYGSQELASFPLPAGEEKTIKVKVDPPYGTTDGKYDVTVRAVTGNTSEAADLTLDITGQPEIAISGADEKVSETAYAGEETPIDVMLTNAGSASARNLKLSATEPSGWKVAFSPETVDAIGPNENMMVKAFVTPSSRAIAGDYMVTVRAQGEGLSKSTDFRITVRTSTMWGIVGVLVIATALIVLMLAVIRYGRR